MVRRNSLERKVDPIEAAIERELVQRDRVTLTASFYEFVKESFSMIEPYDFVDGMHIRAICEHLQAVYERKIRHLLINIQPRSSKSTMCSIAFPAWVLANDPTETFLYASYSHTLALRDSVKTRDLIESDWYRARWPNVQIKEAENLKAAFRLVAGGGRACTSVGGTVTGMGGSIRVVDDPVSAQQAQSDQVRETANEWWKNSWSSRINGNPDRACEIVVMQRLHTADISALAIEQGYETLILPTEYEGSKYVTKIGWTDPRTEHGQLLWPELWGKEYIDEQKRKLGTFGFASQYQQRPAPAGGGLFKKDWLKFYYNPAMGLPEPVQFQDGKGDFYPCVQAPKIFENPAVSASWDLSFKDGANNDYSVGQLWHRDGANHYLIHQYHEKADFTKVVELFRRCQDTYKPYPILVEEAANGAAVISSLRNEISGIIPVTPSGGKFSRASAVAPLLEAGNVWLPHPKQYPWVNDLIDELLVFPAGAHDDQVDAMTQYLTRALTVSSVVVDAAPMGFSSDFEDLGSLVQDYGWDP